MISRQEKKHLFFIFVVAFFIKIIVISFVLSSMNISNLTNDLNKWDSGYYIEIAKADYPKSGKIEGLFAFPPLYPLLIRTLALIFNDYNLSALIVTNIFYFLTLFAFYFVAKIYFTPKKSFYATILFSVFPTFVTYGLVAYSEPIYLFFAITSWYYFIKKNYFLSGSLLSLAILSRYIALFIPLIYLLIIFLENKFYRIKNLNKFKSQFLYLLIPFIVFFFVSFSFSLTTKDILTIFKAQSFWNTEIQWPYAQFKWLLTSWFSVQGDPIRIVLDRYFYTIPFLLLAIYSRHIDKRIFIYSLFFMVIVLSTTGTAAVSAPRLMLAAWPVFLVFGKIDQEEILFALFVILFILSLQTTHMHLTSFFA